MSENSSSCEALVKDSVKIFPHTVYGKYLVNLRLTYHNNTAD